MILLGSFPINWRSKKQSTVPKSSLEVEYRAMSQVASEVTWLVRLLEELRVASMKLVTLHCDNQSTIHIGKNPVFHERTKHIEIDCLMQDKSKEWANRFRKLEYFDIGDLLYFFIILAAYF